MSSRELNLLKTIAERLEELVHRRLAAQPQKWYHPGPIVDPGVYDCCQRLVADALYDGCTPQSTMDAAPGAQRHHAAAGSSEDRKTGPARPGP